MTITLGTNAGFVTTAPTGDPGGTSSQTLDGYSNAIKHTTPSGTTTVTEIGWWASVTPSSEDVEVAIYTDVAGEPVNFVGSKVTGLSTGGTGGVWVRYTGLNISLDASTVYWIGIQVDGGTAQTDHKHSGGQFRQKARIQLVDPFGTATVSNDDVPTVYALVETEEPTGINTSVNIGDVWKDADAMKVNVGDAWKAVDSVKVNVGDSWKTVF